MRSEFQGRLVRMEQRVAGSLKGVLDHHISKIDARGRLRFRHERAWEKVAIPGCENDMAVDRILKGEIDFRADPASQQRITRKDDPSSCVVKRITCISSPEEMPVQPDRERPFRTDCETST